MINYMEKMGKKSPFLTGIYKRPSLRDWDVKMANQDLQKVHELMGLDNGLTYGVKRLHSTEDGPLVMCFDADTCPLSKAEEHLNYCRGAIRVYTTAAETLQRRIAEGSVGTSRENDPVQIQSKKAEENKRSNNEKEKAEKDSSIPQTSTQEKKETACPATQETMLKFPEYFDNDSTKEKCSQSLALVFVPEAKGGEKPTECNEEIVLDATPLRTTLPDEIIDLHNVTTKKRKKHNMLYSDSTYPERRRAVKKSKYLESPYDDAVHESTSSELEKQLSTYAWSPELDPHDLLYCSNNKAHQYALERQALWSLQQDE
ncbi:1-aminocyclopropane-1-carboxylate synthase [Trifolium repens]|nr:1-aminocyclopropane-1-carboxylate synthase [Trifolium repens]